MSTPRGEVFDIGYQHYAGVRQGRRRSRQALWINGIRTALGLGRGWTAKILPGLLVFSLITPAIIFSLIASTLDIIADDIPGHSDFYQIASVILIIFSAVIAPELLCSDRRSGVINLYLVRPMTITDYVIGRWAGFFTVALAVVYLPQIVLLLGLVLGATEPLEYLKDNWLDVPRFILSGLALAIFTTTLPLAAAAFTTRRAYAAAFVIGLWFIARATSAALTGAIGGEAARWFTLIDIGNTPIYINNIIFGLSPGQVRAEAGGLPNAVFILWYVALVAIPAYLLWWRYRRLTA